MLKAVAHGDDHELIVLGLSDENIKRLKNNQPITFDLDQLGIKGIRIFIFAGETEESMAEDMKEFIGPKTKKIDPNA